MGNKRKGGKRRQKRGGNGLVTPVVTDTRPPKRIIPPQPLIRHGQR